MTTVRGLAVQAPVRGPGDSALCTECSVRWGEPVSLEACRPAPQDPPQNASTDPRRRHAGDGPSGVLCQSSKVGSEAEGEEMG